MLNAIYLIGAAVTIAAQSIAKKAYNVRLGDRGAYTFSAVSVVAAALFFLFSYLQERIAAPVYAAREYAPLTAYLLFPLIITAFSVLLIERLEMEKE